MPPHGPGQDDILKITTDGNHVVDGMGVVHAFHRLLDNRSFIEARRHVVRRRSDNLDAAIKGQSVGFGTLEAWQK